MVWGTRKSYSEVQRIRLWDCNYSAVRGINLKLPGFKIFHYASCIPFAVIPFQSDGFKFTQVMLEQDREYAFYVLQALKRPINFEWKKSLEREVWLSIAEERSQQDTGPCRPNQELHADPHHQCCTFPPPAQRCTNGTAMDMSKNLFCMQEEHFRAGKEDNHWEFPHLPTTLFVRNSTHRSPWSCRSQHHIPRACAMGTAAPPN